MKYSIGYHPALTDEEIQEIDSFIFSYPVSKAESKDHMMRLLKFNKEIILNIKTVEDFNMGINFYEAYPHNIILSFGLVDMKQIEKCQEKNIPFMFDHIIMTLEELHYFLNLHPAEIRIDGDICFQLKRIVDNLTKKQNIKIRVIPNKIFTNIDYNAKEELRHFFIRPNDTDIYENYIDTFEFINLDKDVHYDFNLVNIYKTKDWFGKLNEITNLTVDIDNRCIPSFFGAQRFICGQSCFLDNECQICPTLLHLSHTMEKEHYIFT